MARRLPLLAYGLAGVAVLAGLGASVSISNKSQLRAAIEPWFNPPRTAPIVSAPIPQTLPAPQIGAVGLVEPSSQEISIGTDISGTVAKVFAVPGVKVSKGDPLFALDSRLAEAVVAQPPEQGTVAGHTVADAGGGRGAGGRVLPGGPIGATGEGRIDR